MANDLKIPILITGGSGFLGINLVRHLLQKGYKNLTVLDIADFDYPDVKDKISLIKGDIRNKRTIAIKYLFFAMMATLVNIDTQYARGLNFLKFG